MKSLAIFPELSFPLTHPPINFRCAISICLFVWRLVVIVFVSCTVFRSSWEMSSQSGQIVQYKDVLKLMKKKLQIAETQTTGIDFSSWCQVVEIKSKYDALEATMIGFLEYVTKPFSGSAWLDVSNARKQSTAGLNECGSALLVGRESGVWGCNSCSRRRDCF